MLASRPMFLLSFLFLTLTASANPVHLNGLYVNSYGNDQNPALIFVHGGPGYDSQDFEVSTAAALSSHGFFVVVYDQRGQGRSDVATDVKEYSYRQYADDLHSIIQHYQLKHPTLLGHSHGGPISLQFDQMYPGVAGKIVLVSAPINFYQSLNSIRVNCPSNQKLESDFAVLENSEAIIEKQIEAVGDIFLIGTSKACGLYVTRTPTEEAKVLKQLVAKNHVKIVDENVFYPMPGFMVNDNYIHLDQTEWVQKNASHIFGIYGDEDGLFTPQALADIGQALSGNSSSYRMQILTQASHGLYIDQQAKFIAALMNVL